MTEPADERTGTRTSAEAAFFAALHDLYARAGQPSSREMAKAIGGVSHTTLNAAIRGTSVPSWNITEKLVEYLGGDLDAFRNYWADTRPDAQPRRSYSGPEVSIFVSYARIDDKSSYSRISKIIDDLADTYQSMTGQNVGVFKDVESITPGDDWRDRIRLGLSSSSIFLAFITPAYLRSVYCREELSQFLAFLDANSSARLVIPLLFAAPDRIMNDFSDDALWLRIASLEWLDVSGMRYQEPGSSSWLITIDKIADTIGEVLRTFPPNNDEATTQGEAGDGKAELSDGTLDHMARLERDVIPAVQSTMASFSHLIDEMNSAVNLSTPAMRQADSFSKKLAVSRELARTLTPIANEMELEAKRLSDYFKEITYFTNFVVDMVRKYPEEVQIETVNLLNSIKYMASVGVNSFSIIETFSKSVGQSIGFSRELDIPLKKIQGATLKIADLRGIFSGWLEEVGTLRDRYPDLGL